MDSKSLLSWYLTNILAKATFSGLPIATPDVLVEKGNEGFLTFVFRKPTLLDSTFVGIRLHLHNVKPTLLKHLRIDH